MGLTLVVFPSGRHPELRKFPLGDTPIAIGSGQSDHVALDVAGIREGHAQIRFHRGEWLLTGDEMCSVGDVPLSEQLSRVVRVGDTIWIGDASMEIRLLDDEPDVAPTLQYRRPPDVVTVRVVEGPDVGLELALNEDGRSYLVGRRATCGLRLGDRNVSREHLELLRRGDQVLVLDRLTTCGSWLGLSRLVPQRRALWNGKRMLRIGSTVLTVDEPMEWATRVITQEDVPATPSSKMMIYDDEGRDASAIVSQITAPLPLMRAKEAPKSSGAGKWLARIGIVFVCLLVLGALAVVVVLSR